MNFIKRIFQAIWRTIKNVVIDIVSNIESVIILSASAIGVSAIIQQIPFHYTLPLWIETPLVIPAISILTILTLVTILQWRTGYARQHI